MDSTRSNGQHLFMSVDDDNDGNDDTGCPKKTTGCPKNCRVSQRKCRVSQKKVLTECCWSHGAAGTPFWNLSFWSFFTQQDQALPSNFHEPLHSILVRIFFSVSYFILGHTVLALYHDGDDYMNRIRSKSRHPYICSTQLHYISLLLGW